MRKTQLSVTNFLHCGDDYLFVLRSADRAVDAGKLNGIGGKLHEGEDFLSAALRETKEETGYSVNPEEARLAGLVTLQGGYEDDWVMCFFTMEVATKDIPIGPETPEGKLLWLPKNAVLTCDYTLVDDLHYLWEKIIAGEEQFFMNAIVGSDEKISSYSLSTLKR